jgi:hypothetical protein
VQFTVDEARTKSLNLSFGYHYHDVINNHDIINNQDMIDVHVDYWMKKQDQQAVVANDDNINNTNQEVTPRTSIRVLSKRRPIMIILSVRPILAWKQDMGGSK